MLYDAYEVQRSLLAGASRMAGLGAGWISNPSNPFAYGAMGPVVAAGLDVFAHATATRAKPEWEITETLVDGHHVAVDEDIVERRPFGNLLHFHKADGKGEGQAPMLIVAPMSGHFATLLRGTVKRMLPAHDVYITDWADAKTVPLTAGSFDLDNYVDYLIDFLRDIHGKTGQRPHMLAVCQPSVPAFAATAVMGGEDDPARPATLTMMGGPIDTREQPTAVNTLATQRPHAWFQQNVIATVPYMYPGAGRKVYPGFLQLAGFMTMNLGSHLMSHWEMFKHLVEGDDESADKTREFYDEYRAVADMTAEFYLQTVDVVFQRHLLPKNEFMHRGKLVDLTEITDTALLAIEGERDDISGLGQTKAALKLATHLPEKMKRYYMAEGVGHYGIFHGGKWRDKIAPVVEEFVEKHRA
ncbi:polyhydroxyalkanoate depolymerase [Sphingomicrobium clamense]|uniref:Polyhydroxyalkanoate depolymerase n=1 Tax=Sphingomicrobium clamense TaxID=2851013 RepID=A0ABS6V7W3_9SPHN|nr:polyhydroxyalkanoate depolymerase [Sphingomicrobium sp. B8]MBW0145430.1 polyhydroxyalkanoate depolymerase [Sphingomicrobium sp. B8]